MGQVQDLVKALIGKESDTAVLIESLRELSFILEAENEKRIGIENPYISVSQDGSTTDAQLNPGGAVDLPSLQAIGIGARLIDQDDLGPRLRTWLRYTRNANADIGPVYLRSENDSVILGKYQTLVNSRDKLYIPAEMATAGSIGARIVSDAGDASRPYLHLSDSASDITEEGNIVIRRTHAHASGAGLTVLTPAGGPTFIKQRSGTGRRFYQITGLGVSGNDWGFATDTSESAGGVAQNDYLWAYIHHGINPWVWVNVGAGLSDQLVVSTFLPSNIDSAYLAWFFAGQNSRIKIGGTGGAGASQTGIDFHIDNSDLGGYDIFGLEDVNDVGTPGGDNLGITVNDAAAFMVKDDATVWAFGNLNIHNGKELRVWDAGSSHYWSMVAPALLANQSFVLPERPATSDEILVGSSADPSILAFKTAAELSIPTGTGADGRFTLWNGANTITSLPVFTYLWSGNVAQTFIGDGTTNLSGAQVTINAPAGTFRSLVFSSNAARWLVAADNSAESGGNAGSDFAIGRYSDVPVFIDYPLKIVRSTGEVRLNSLTATRLVYSDANKALQSIGALTEHHVLHADVNGLPEGSANLTFDGTVLTALQYVRIGTATDANGQGDFSAGLAGGQRLVYDTGFAIMDLYDSSNALAIRLDSAMAGGGHIDILGSGAGGSKFGYRSQPTLTGSTTAFDSYISTLTVSAGTLTTYRGVMIQTPTGAGAVTNAYGLYIESQTKGGTLNRAIYTDGASDGIEFRSWLNVGASAPAGFASQGDFVAGSSSNYAAYDNSTDLLTLTGGATINESGQDIDTRIEGDNKTNCLLIDASDDEVAIDGRFSLVALSPAQITADQNDYNPESTATNRSSFWRLSTDASRTVTGIANGLDGRILVIANAGSFDLVIANQSASSTAGNRIITGTGADVTVAADGTATLIYDNTTARWRILTAN